jgi:hypothetical protein
VRETVEKSKTTKVLPFLIFVFDPHKERPNKVGIEKLILCLRFKKQKKAERLTSIVMKILTLYQHTE